MQHNKEIENYWSLDIEHLEKLLETNINYGFTNKKADQLINSLGKNIFHGKEKQSPLSILLKQFSSPLIFILIGAGIVTATLNEWVETIVIFFAVAINAGLGFYREYHAENTLEKLNSFIKDRAKVIRDGFEQEIDAEQIIPGDIIKVSYGNRIPADAVIIDCNNARADEAILTGESISVSKENQKTSATTILSERKNVLHAGTLMVEGFAKAIVVKTGDKTQIGSIASLVSKTGRVATPIQRGIVSLSWFIFSFVLLIIIGIFGLGISQGEPFLQMLILSVAISVGAVPEALPIALTVILSNGAERIAKKKGITRTLMAAETLGSASVIMTDKTGTLTEANMRLVSTYTKQEITLNSETQGLDLNLLRYALACSDITIENPKDKKENWSFKGKPFEVSIAQKARELKVNIDGLQDVSINKIKIPFNSAYKFSVAQNEEKFFVMGAPDILLDRSNIDLASYKKIEQWISDKSLEGKRLLAVAGLPEKTNPVHINDVKECDFIGILVFHDPIRKEVPDAIKKIESLGIRIIMVTGDLKGTAMSVAKDIGWSNIKEENVITGSELSQLSDESLKQLLPSIKIFSRVTPKDKLRIGQILQQQGEVVAMTGDGVNDAPALKAMDIGVALGSGSDVAKSASDLILLDDNFQTISSSIIEGRRILANIRKTFVYLMSNSLDAVFVVGGSIILGMSIPLTALQIIWVNLFTGSFPALSFAFDENFDHQYTKKESSKKVLTKPVSILTFGVGMLSSILLFVLYYSLINFGVNQDLSKSIFFACFSTYILAASYSFRSIYKPITSYPIFSNKKLNISIVFAFCLLILTFSVPIIRNTFGLVTLPALWIIFVVVWMLFNMSLVELAKLIFRKTI